MQDTKTAVALSYIPGEGAVPTLIAKGTGYVAEDILRIARENDIPLRQEPALAGALATLDIGQQIPPQLFRAVAEVLAFVYKMNGKA